jgi:hypothetical protein
MLRVSEQWSKPVGGTLDEVWEGVRLNRRGKLVDIGEEGGLSGLMDGGMEGGSTLIEVGDESEVGMSDAKGTGGST